MNKMHDLSGELAFVVHALCHLPLLVSQFKLQTVLLSRYILVPLPCVELYDIAENRTHESSSLPRIKQFVQLQARFPKSTYGYYFLDRTCSETFIYLNQAGPIVLSAGQVSSTALLPCPDYCKGASGVANSYVSSHI